MSKSDNKAVALKYVPSQDYSPVVIASGYGTVAENIINIAEKKGVPVYRDDSIASMLCMLDVGKNIPPDLYEIIAKVYCNILSSAAKFKGINEEPADNPTSNIKENGEDE